MSYKRYKLIRKSKLLHVYNFKLSFFLGGGIILDQKQNTFYTPQVKYVVVYLSCTRDLSC